MPFLPRNPEHHTTDVIALHRATLENPLDDTPHLVYADAMDDAGAHEEAHTLRRLVKLRAAMGGKAVMPHPRGPGVSMYDISQMRKKVIVGTNQADVDERAIPDFDKPRTPFIRLPDVMHDRQYTRVGTNPASERADHLHLNRRLYFIPQTGGAAVVANHTTRYFAPRERRQIGESNPQFTRTFIAPDTVQHLLGEHDAQ